MASSEEGASIDARHADLSGVGSLGTLTCYHLAADDESYPAFAMFDTSD